MFKGEYSHSIDSKGRVIVPAKFRDKLGEESVLTKGLDGCLYVYPKEEWIKFEEKLNQLPLNRKDARKMTRFFFAGAADCEIDKQGRVLIPAVLREFAGLEKEVVMVGIMNRIEIWSRERWNDTNVYDDMEDIAEQMEEFGLLL
ncbi:MAG: division/cell wall cluster transcriptional repressor MraZ [Lachnospiraceae bacterium]|nr:division/cell wall cluster transcriptional repressor MraZ [Lachnospiraceae bacterium]